MRTKCMLLLFLAVTLSNGLKAQIPITLEAALDTALKNNPGIKQAKLQTELQKQLISTGAALPNTAIVAEYGQINSSYTDNRFGINQSINFPSVYSAQKKVLQEEWKTAGLREQLSARELKRNLYSLYFALLSLREKETLLMKADGLYDEFYKRSDLRYGKGETNVLELTAAKSQQASIHLQLMYLRVEKKQREMDFNLLLNGFVAYTTGDSIYQLELPAGLTPEVNLQHPSFLVFEQQKKMYLAAEKLERRKLLPDFNLGYYNMTMVGNGADNLYYNKSSRFQSVQAGLGIPLFYGAQKAKVRAAALNTKISSNLLESEQKRLAAEMKRLLDSRELLKQSVAYYESEVLNNIYIAEGAVAAKLQTGDISFLEWVTEVNQIIKVHADYIDAIEGLNKNTIELIYLTETK